MCVCVLFGGGGRGWDVVGQWFWGGLCVSHGQIGECVRIREGDSVGGEPSAGSRFSLCGFAF